MSNDPGEPETAETTTVFDFVGGQSYFDVLVDSFYALVAADPVLLVLYPETQDLGPAKERLALFLGQYWGGPQTYSERRGHPRLRMRHAPFVIGLTERNHWMDAMSAAMDEVGVPGGIRERFDAYFSSSADAMINDSPPGRPDATRIPLRNLPITPPSDHQR